jgi:hypothetical protein
MAEDYEVQAEEVVEAAPEAVKNLEQFEATSEEVLEVVVEERVEPEVVAEVEVEKPKPTPAVLSPKRGKAPEKSVESKIEAVEVVLSALTYQAASRNSASVRVLQDRLAELGHGSVRRDRQGWLSDGTVEALREFQAEAGLDATGEADQATVEAVLKGTKAKVVV